MTIHFLKSKVGFYADFDGFLSHEAQLESLPEWKKHIVLAFDEVKLKEVWSMQT